MLRSTNKLLPRSESMLAPWAVDFSGRVFVCFITPRIAYEAVSFSRQRVEEKFVLTA